MLEYKDLIADCQLADSSNLYEKDLVAAAKTPRAKKPTAEYTVEMISHCDFAVRRKSKRREELLIALISRGELRIKDVISNTVEVLTAEDYVRFMTDAPQEGIPLVLDGNKCSWLPRLLRGKGFGFFLVNIAGGSQLRAFISCDFISFSESMLTRIGAGDVNSTRLSSGSVFNHGILEQAFNAAKATGQAEEFKIAFTKYIAFLGGGGKLVSLIEKLNNSSFKVEEMLKCLMDWCGISGIYQIMHEYMRSAVSAFPSSYVWLGLLAPDNKPRTYQSFDLQRTIQYLFYQSVEQGFAFQLESFIQTWTDTLNMQERVYGKIVNKYPNNLLSEHQILSYKTFLLKQEIDEEKWASVSAEMAKHEKTGKEYVILAPKTPDDMFEEARMQSNCLSSYVGSVTDGKCQIYFLRKRSNLEKSFVTIEVRSDGSLGQVLGRFNRTPDSSVINYVTSWWESEFKK